MSRNLMYLQLRHVLCFLASACMVMLPVRAQDQAMGNLFSSPKERADLDQLRQHPDKTQLEVNAPPENKLGDQITLNGFVRNSHGKTTVWINQLPQHGQESPQGITISPSGPNPTSLSIRLPSGKNLRLKTGQSVDTTSNKVTDVLDTVVPSAVPSVVIPVAPPVTKEPAK